MFSILHFADLHLRDPLAGDEEDRRLELAKRQVLARIVDLALALGVDAVTAGGDLYEHDVATTEAAQSLQGQFARLGRTPVLIAPGNHDPYTPDSLYRATPWSRNVIVFRGPQWTPVTLSEEVTLWGAGHDRPALETNLLRELRLDPSRGDIALLHGWDLQAAPRTGMAYCPFTMEDVERSGAAFVLLGHYHDVRLAPHAAPRYGYPGAAAPVGGRSQKTRYALLLSIDGRSMNVEPIAITAGSSHAAMASLAQAAG